MINPTKVADSSSVSDSPGEYKGECTKSAEEPFLDAKNAPQGVTIRRDFTHVVSES
jgi:hypothetical protein